MHGWQWSVVVVESRRADRVEKGTMTSGTAARFMRVFVAFSRYALASGVADPREVSAGLCQRFVSAPKGGGCVPTGSTGRVRLSAIRSAFECLVEAGLVATNPTLGLRVSGTPSVVLPCPVTPEEAQRLLVGGRLFSTDTLRPACVALALAGATHVEVARAAVADFDPATGRVRIGSKTTSARTISLGVAATAALTGRVGALRRECRRRKQSWVPALVPLAMYRPVSSYPASSVAPTVSMNLSRAMNRAGVTRAGVRSRSCREYAANTAYAQTRRVEDVARCLGMVSLDAADRMLDWGWQQQFGRVVNALDTGLG